MIELFSYSFNHIDLLLIVIVAMLIGMAKTGIAGAGMIAVPLLAMVFGGRESTGVILPILLIADVFAITHYHKHADWEHLHKLLPFALLGVIIGTVCGGVIDDRAFTLIMALIIFVSLGIMIWQECTKQKGVPRSIWFTSGIGVIGGITTMIGNLAGPIMALYLLAMRLPKHAFIGTAAWFFMCINLIKVPFHVFAWETITFQSTLLSLTQP